MTNIIAYKYSGMPQVIKKNITPVKTVAGQFRQPFNLMNPIVEMGKDILDYLNRSTVNYFKIEGKYYYLIDWKVTSRDIVEVHMHLDALTTYQNEIGNLRVMLERSSSFSRNDIPDNMYPLSNTIAAEDIYFPREFDDSEAAGSYVLVTSQKGYTTSTAPAADDPINPPVENTQPQYPVEDEQEGTGPPVDSVIPIEVDNPYTPPTPVPGTVSTNPLDPEDIDSPTYSPPIELFENIITPEGGVTRTNTSNVIRLTIDADTSLNRVLTWESSNSSILTVEPSGGVSSFYYVNFTTHDIVGDVVLTGTDTMTGEKTIIPIAVMRFEMAIEYLSQLTRAIENTSPNRTMGTFEFRYHEQYIGEPHIVLSSTLELPDSMVNKAVTIEPIGPPHLMVMNLTETHMTLSYAYLEDPSSFYPSGGVDKIYATGINLKVDGVDSGASWNLEYTFVP